MTKITSQTYDDHVLFHGPQACIDIYYEPKAPADRLRINVILKHLAPGQGERVLDVGCGVGTFAFHAAKRGAFAVGLDYSKESVKMARDLSRRYNLSGQANFVQGSAFCLPFPDASFDKAAVIDFIEHITHQEKEEFVKELSRVLKDGDHAVIFTPNGVREKIGEVYWKVRSLLFKEKIPKNSLHYGLISRERFEALLKKYGFIFEFYYYDLTRPFLAKIPFLNNFLSLNLLWVVYKK